MQSRPCCMMLSFVVYYEAMNLDVIFSRLLCKAFKLRVLLSYVIVVLAPNYSASNCFSLFKSRLTEFVSRFLLLMFFNKF